MKNLGIYLSSIPFSGGVYQYSLSILEALSQFDNKKYNIKAFYVQDEWMKICDEYNIKCKKVRMSKIHYKLLAVLSSRLPYCGVTVKLTDVLLPVTRALNKEKIDLCIYPVEESFSYMSSIKGLGTIHDIMHRFEDFPEIKGKKVYRTRDKNYNKMVKYARGILVDSNIGKKQIIETYLEGDNHKIFPLPYISPQYAYRKQEDSIKQEINISEKLPEKYIFYPAQFWFHKNHKNLLLAIAKLKKKEIRINAVFVGSKKNGFEEIERIIQKYKLENQIYILGYVSNEELKYLYQNAVAMVMPTFLGPTNIPQLEAFFLGCPVATSRIYGIPEQVGEAAVLFDPRSIDEIGTAVEKLWIDEELRNRLIEEGYARVAEWGIKQFKERLEEIVSMIIS